MTAEQIIREIAALSPEEQAKVFQFARGLDAKHSSSPRALSALAERMASATNPAEAALLRDEITRGFYGGTPHG